MKNPLEKPNKTEKSLYICVCSQWIFDEIVTRDVTRTSVLAFVSSVRSPLTSSSLASTTPLQDLPSPPPLLLLLDVSCPDLKSLFLCRLARVHQEDCRTFTRKSSEDSRRANQVHLWLSLASHFTSQERACKCTVDFHSQVTTNLLSKCILENVLSKCTAKFVS